MTDNTPSCPRIDRWLRGCRFEGRYDLGVADLSKVDGDLRGCNVLDKFRARTYIRDVCVTCGRTIERGAS